MQKRFEQILIALGAIFYLFVFPHGIHGDGAPRFITLEALITRGEWVDSKYPMLGTLISAPLYYLGYVVKNHHWWVSRYNSILFLVLVYMLWRWLRPSLGEAVARRFVLLLMTASMFARHATDFYGEIFTATCLALGTIAILQRREKVGALFLALAAVNTPAVLLPMALVVGVFFLWYRKPFVLFSVPLAVALILLENWLRRGDPKHFGYVFALEASDKTIQPYSGLPGFSYPFGFGLLSILFSFGKGLIFFVPGFFVLPWALKGTNEFTRRLAAIWAVAVFGLILIYARWNAWHGAWYWGPRFFLFASLPAALALAYWFEAKKPGPIAEWTRLFLLTLSVWVSASGVAFGLNNMEMCAREMEYVCLYVPEFSPLWRPFIAEKSLTGKQTAFLVFHFLAWAVVALPALQRLGQGNFRWRAGRA